jgi:hypothetical protein
MPSKIITLILLLLIIPIAASEEEEQPREGITPDSSLYSLDKSFERISLLLTFNHASKAEKKLKIAGERLAELKAMINKGKPEYSIGLAHEYYENINSANEITKESKISKEEKTRLLILINHRTSKHRLVLEDLETRVPLEAKGAVRKAKFASHAEKVNQEDEENSGDYLKTTGEKINQAKERAKDEKGKAEDKSDRVLDSMSDKIAKGFKEKLRVDEET